MLIKAPLVKNGIEKLHAEISYFISQLETRTKWSRKLFHDDFYDAVVSESSALEDRLKTFFKEFNKLPPYRKAEIVKEFNEHNSIRTLCDTKRNVTRYWKDSTYPEFVEAVEGLFIWMYGATLERVNYKNFSGESLRDHYSAYRRVYDLAMCPFCGLEDYKDLHDELVTRDAYDHYLDKASYPFAAVNPDNLFPMCHSCNSDTKKMQDVLYENVTNTRRFAPYPPEDEFEVSIQIDNALLLSPIVIIALRNASSPQTVEKFSTWMMVFKIPQRYEGRVKKKKQDWLIDSVGNLSLTMMDTELPERLKTAHERCLSSLELRRQSNNDLKASFLAYCVAHSASIINFFRHDPSYARYLTARTKALNTV